MSLWSRYLELASRGEPFRILFPIGAALGVLGVMLWPAFVYGWLPLYPGIAHARIMTQGFVFCFMAGFLGSALPHMLEIKGMSLAQSSLLAAMIVTVSVLHLAGKTVAADTVFAVTVITLMALILRRWRERKDMPPPGMALAVLGLLSGITGSLLLALHSQASLPMWYYLFGKTLLFHGMILFPVLGLGSYLLPRMAGLPNKHLLPKSRAPSAAWKQRAFFMLGCGLVLLGSFVLEAFAMFREAFALRAVTAAFCLLHETPLFRAPKIKGSIPWTLMISVVSILAGYMLLAIWPQWQKSMIHVVFISGIGLLILGIAARVMLGHSGNTPLIYARFLSVKWITGLAILAMATRVSADLIPKMQLSHYAYAAITWAVLTLIWLARFSPFLVMAEGNDEA